MQTPISSIEGGSMPRTARKQSGSSVYHIVNRGAGKQIIFEDDADRAFFMKKLEALLDEEGGTLLAWCLMGNHFHLLATIPFERLNELMHRLQTSYAGYFNRVYGHVGAVFEGRFKSEPVETDEYLMTVVRYIHENPRKGGVYNGLDYPWSSYREYCGKKGYADTSFVLDVFGGLSQFKTFHDAQHQDERCLEAREVPLRGLSDEDARCIADKLLEDVAVGSLKGTDRQTRDKALAMLKARGLSVRQIQRMTGISLGVISKAGKEMNT